MFFSSSPWFISVTFFFSEEMDGDDLKKEMLICPLVGKTFLCLTVQLKGETVGVFLYISRNCFGTCVRCVLLLLFSGEH